jgi:alginate O-acetyltransferase complex protein AlgI
VAGPIVRFSTISRQLVRRVVTSRHIYYGCFYFAVGLAQKVLIADTMASVADPLFANWANLSVAATWLAVVAYSFQIFFDFGGYSNMAIGLGYLIGFQFPLNFNKPYISQSITDFWRRWHISLSTWFRDYLYIPLGGNRKSAVRTYANLCTVFVICGLWHGAAWTFLFWGVYHGALLIVERAGLGRILQRTPHVVQHVYALLAIMIGWVFFRSETLSQGFGMIGTMFGLQPAGGASIWEYLTHEAMLVLVLAAIFSTWAFERLVGGLVALPRLRPWPRHVEPSAYGLGGTLALLLFLTSAAKILAGSYSPFIYFRF